MRRGRRRARRLSEAILKRDGEPQWVQLERVPEANR
jgi:hypothetical protein